MLNEWRTNLEGATGENGTYSSRAFLGDFVVTAVMGDKSVAAEVSVLRNLDDPNEVTVRLP